MNNDTNVYIGITLAFLCWCMNHSLKRIPKMILCIQDADVFPAFSAPRQQHDQYSVNGSHEALCTAQVIKLDKILSSINDMPERFPYNRCRGSSPMGCGPWDFISGPGWHKPSPVRNWVAVGHGKSSLLRRVIIGLLKLQWILPVNTSKLWLCLCVLLFFLVERLFVVEWEMCITGSHLEFIMGNPRP